VKKTYQSNGQAGDGTKLVPVPRQVLQAAMHTGRLIIFVLVCSQVGFAISLNEYHQRVKFAIHSLELIVDAESQAEADKDSDILTKLRDVREALGRKETVEWNGTKFVVDNSWLEDQLKEYEQTSSSEPTRSAVVQRSLEQLNALDQRLNEVEQVATDPLPGKAELRDRLASILQRSEYIRAAKEESALSRLMKWLLKWISSLFPERRVISPGSAIAVSRLAQIAVIAIALAVIGYVVWKFAPRFLRRRKGMKPAKAKARVVLGEQLEPDQSASDLLAEAEALARNGDLRGAIRRGYIALLVELADRKLISLAQYKTNRDYLRSVQEIRNLHRNMEALTNNFEQHWYGLVAADENDWAAFRAGYKEAITSA
jgi:hypothetical protein